MLLDLRSLWESTDVVPAGSGDDAPFLAAYWQQRLRDQQQPASRPEALVVRGVARCVAAPADVRGWGRMVRNVARALAALEAEPWMRAKRQNDEDEQFLQAIGVL